MSHAVPPLFALRKRGKLQFPHPRIPRHATVTVISQAAQGARRQRMARFTGVLGLLTMLGVGVLVFPTNRRAIKLKTVAWGAGAADHVRVSRVLLDIWAAAFFSRGQCCKQAAGVRVEGSFFVFGELGSSILDRFHLRVSGSSDDYFHRPRFLHSCTTSV